MCFEPRDGIKERRHNWRQKIEDWRTERNGAPPPVSGQFIIVGDDRSRLSKFRLSTPVTSRGFGCGGNVFRF